jgi:hypothetical protein
LQSVAWSSWALMRVLPHSTLNRTKTSKKLSFSSATPRGSKVLTSREHSPQWCVQRRGKTRVGFFSRWVICLRRMVRLLPDHLVALTDSGLQAGSVQHWDVPAAVVDQSGTLQLSGRLGHALAPHTQHIVDQVLGPHPNAACSDWTTPCVGWR